MEHEAALTGVPVVRIDAVFQIHQVVVSDGGGLARRAHLALGGSRHHAARLVDAGADGEVLIGDPADAPRQQAPHVGFDVDARVLEQLEGNRHRLGRVLVGRDGHDAEARVRRRDGRVLANDLAFLGGIVNGGPGNFVPHGRAHDRGHLAHAAVGRDLFKELPAEAFRHQVAALGAGARGHGAEHLLRLGAAFGHVEHLIRRERGHAAAQPAVEDDPFLFQGGFGFASGHAARDGAALDPLIVQRFHVGHPFVARDFAVQAVDFRLQGVESLLLIVAPLVAGVVVQKFAGLLRLRLTLFP